MLSTKEGFVEILEFTHFVRFFSFDKVGENHKEKLLVRFGELFRQSLPKGYGQLSKEMLLVEKVDDKQLLAQLFERMYPELPSPKPKKPKTKKKQVD